MVSNLPPSPNIFTESKVTSYHDSITFKELNFEFSETSPERILNTFEGLNPSNAAGINKLSGKFLKDGADILAKPISQLCNLSIKLNSFPRSCNVAKVKPHYKKTPKWTLKTSTPFHYSPSYQKLLKV